MSVNCELKRKYLHNEETYRTVTDFGGSNAGGIVSRELFWKSLHYADNILHKSISQKVLRENICLDCHTE